MKTAIVHEMLIKLGGAERVVKTLTKLLPEAPVYTLFQDKEKTKAWFGDIKVQESSLGGVYPLIQQPKYLLNKMAKAIESFDFKKYDTVISSSSAFAHGIITPKEVKHITYCHSPMRYAWDYTHQYTKYMSGISQLAAAKLLNEIRLWDYEASKRSDIVIANSKHVQKRVAKYWRRDAHVIYPPVETTKFEAQSTHEDYFLIVSALTPFKRIDLAIEAFNKIGRKLIIIGDGAQRKILESMAKENIEFLGRKSDEVVKEYMQNCRAFIFPGEEDFGITPVEAMAAGKPVLAYGKGGVLETVIASKTGEFFPKTDSKSLIEGLTRLMLNEKHYDYKKIAAHAKKFDTAIFEEKMNKIIS